ncbi:MAG: FixH family protein [Acidimicrobiales bacterium]
MTDDAAKKSNGMSPAARIGAVVVVAAMAFGAAFLLFGGDSDNPADVAGGGGGKAAGNNGAGSGDDSDTCAAKDATDAAGSPYKVMVTTEPNPPKPQGSTFQITVERDGKPLEGAAVCVTANMTEMEMDAVGGRAQEVEAGRFELPVDFGMRGAWGGSVVVSEPGQTPVSMPLSFDVQ